MEKLVNKINTYGFLRFLEDYPELSFKPLDGRNIILQGDFKFKANVNGFPSIKDSYELKIVIPENFPFNLPEVTEIGGKIPKEAEFHTNFDGTLCLGTPLRVFKELSKSSNINIYSDKFLVPYLYAVSHKLQYGGEFIFGELSHGSLGIIEDYCDLLGLKKREQVIYALKLLCIGKKEANKRTCPCGCDVRLSSCNDTHRKLSELRKSVPREYFVKDLKNLNTMLGT